MILCSVCENRIDPDSNYQCFFCQEIFCPDCMDAHDWRAEENQYKAWYEQQVREFNHEQTGAMT